MIIQQLATSAESFEQQFAQLLHWDMHTDSELDQRVAAILGQVRQRGDDAVLELTNELDRRNLTAPADFVLSAETLQAAWHRVQPQHQDALQLAAERIRIFHERQLESSWSFQDDLGNQLGQRISPLETVGVYVPGGQAAYPSSVLMTLIPAKVAGVENIVVTVPTPAGEASDMVLAALHLGGADQVFSIGGAQAIGALAYGTQSVPRVDKIVGPGGAYVATAKKQVFGQVGIDMIAGPSEVLILADGSTPVDWAVMDLFSQAEHDPSAQSILISDNRGYIEQVAARIAALLPDMTRAEIIRDSLSQRGALIHCADKQEALALANRIAPEHLSWRCSTRKIGLMVFAMQGPYFVALIPAKLLATMWPGLLMCYRPLAPLVLPRPSAYTTFKSALRSCRCQPMGPVHCRKLRIRWRKPKGCLPMRKLQNCVAAPIRIQT